MRKNAVHRNAVLRIGFWSPLVDVFLRGYSSDWPMIKVIESYGSMTELGEVRQRPLLLSPAAYDRPRYMPQSSWIAHAPFAFFVVDALRPKTIVELGTHYGYSYFTFMQALAELKSRGFATQSRGYAIDTWVGDEHSNYYGPEVFEKVQQQNALYDDFSTLIRASFTEALSEFPDGSIDLLHIDGKHEYEDITRDLAEYAPKIARGGVILLHDTSLMFPAEVRRRFLEVARYLNSFEFHHGYGLGILTDPSYPPPPPLSLLTSGLKKPLAFWVRTVYASLGSLMECFLPRDPEYFNWLLAETARMELRYLGDP